MSPIFAYEAMADVEAKAQQLPHMPWSLTLEMTPCSRQSTDSGRSSSLMSRLAAPWVKLVLTRARELRRPLAYVSINSSLIIENNK